MDTQTTINPEGAMFPTLALENPDGKSTQEGRKAYYRIVYEQRREPSMHECFFAFGEEQFRNAIHNLKLQEAYDQNRIRSAGLGLYGTKEGLARLHRERGRIEREQREALTAAGVTPQDAYLAEYDNHECMYNLDGDLQALHCVAFWFGANAVRRITRKGYGGPDIESFINKL